jgi:hypothetical protein
MKPHSLPRHKAVWEVGSGGTTSAYGTSCFSQNTTTSFTSFFPKVVTYPGVRDVSAYRATLSLQVCSSCSAISPFSGILLLVTAVSFIPYLCTFRFHSRHSRTDSHIPATGWKRRSCSRRFNYLFFSTTNKRLERVMLVSACDKGEQCTHHPPHPRP